MRARILYLLLVVGYAAAFAPLGVSDPDDGLSLAFARRVAHGELPYVDFIYSKPPLSPYLQAAELAWLPDRMQILAGRAGFYALIALCAWLSARLLCREFGARAAGIDPALLAAAGFVFGAHDFPAMPWHSVDGLALATLGAVALARGWTAPGALLLALSALTKQSYYPLLALAPVLAGALHGRRAAAVAAAVVALVVGAAAAALVPLGMLRPALEQTRAVSGLGGLVQSGVSAYLGCSVAQVVPALGLGWLARERARRRGREFDRGLALAAGFALLLAEILAGALAPQLRPLFAIASSYNPETLLVLAAGVAALELGAAPRAAKLWLALLAIAWCSGITYGGQGPGFAAVPLLFGALLFALHRLHTRHLRALQWLLVVGGIAAFAVSYRAGAPGRRLGPLGTLESLGRVAPSLAPLRDSPAAVEKYASAAEALGRYGPRTVVLPGMPLLLVGLGAESPLPVDLVAPIDTAGQGEWVQRALDNGVDHVLLELDEQRPGGVYDSPVVEEVRREWPLVERLPQFEVRRNPRLGASRPD